MNFQPPHMGLYKFIRLPEQDKADITWDQGTFLMSRNTDDLKINLNGLDDFYVDVWYKPELNYIQKISAIRSVDALAPYLDLIEMVW